MIAAMPMHNGEQQKYNIILDASTFRIAVGNSSQKMGLTARIRTHFSRHQNVNMKIDLSGCSFISDSTYLQFATPMRIVVWTIVSMSQHFWFYRKMYLCGLWRCSTRLCHLEVIENFGQIVLPTLSWVQTKWLDKYNFIFDIRAVLSRNTLNKDFHETSWIFSVRIANIFIVERMWYKWHTWRLTED